MSINYNELLAQNNLHPDFDSLLDITFDKGVKYKIWVDDVREVPKGYFGTKSVDETIAMIKKIERDGGEIELIDLDHDLGDYEKFGGDAIKILDFLCERETFYGVRLHTANAVGRENMMRTIRRFWGEETIH